MTKSWRDLTDRERDALVAEKVMGWQRVESPGMRITLLLPGEMAKAGYGISMAASWDRIGDVSVPVATLSKAVKESGLEWLWRKHARDTLPHYSTDIAAAWEIVEELQRQGITVEVYNGSRGGCTTKILDFEKERKWKSTSVDGAPEAICLAVLKAAGYEDEV